ncbi:uncharacterized protein LOC135114047 [Scylla paramamosain]|uniref:uncharacterized protein LOC135114047 n=1 Tax=Scylla paramamosain TaxID=85552 RepID=UPI003083879D
MPPSTRSLMCNVYPGGMYLSACVKDPATPAFLLPRKARRASDQIAYVLSVGRLLSSGATTRVYVSEGAAADSRK